MSAKREQTERKSAPIGVFDSGVGGLTVAREIMRQIPNERLVYFGDTARVPYGNKSKETVTKFSRQIVRFLETQNVKAIVVACNTASAYALDEIEQELDIPVIGVVKPGAKVAVSGFEHNAVTRPLHALNAQLIVCGRRLFDQEDTLSDFRRALRTGVDAAVFTHVSNVFGCILPVKDMAALCRSYGVPFIVDAAQSAGVLPVELAGWGADFIAMPGHKGLLGPQGTGLLLCAGEAQPLLYGGTGSQSLMQTMPEELPERLEPGTVNVPGAAGLLAGMQAVERLGMEAIAAREAALAKKCAAGLKKMGMEVFSGENQGGTVSFRAGCGCEEAAQMLSDRGFALRAGLHCAPLAHESAGTVDTGTVRVSFGWHSTAGELNAFLRAARSLPPAV